MALYSIALVIYYATVHNAQHKLERIVMNSNEKALARIKFKLKVHESNGQAYENLFVSIMGYADSEFRPVKPQGNIGDRKNDGYNKDKGVYYQVFAPEDARKSPSSAISKIKTDFAGLVKAWSPVNEFYFVLNDKYQGAYPETEQAVEDLRKQYGVTKAGTFLAKHLEETLFSLDDDMVSSIIGFVGDPASVVKLNYSVLNEVVAHIMGIPMHVKSSSQLVAPDWEEKMRFNGLSGFVDDQLTSASYMVGELDQYLKNNSGFLAQELRNQMCDIYQETIADPWMSRKDNADAAFWEIVNRACPREVSMYQKAVLVVMAKYFESCDIFEEPTQC